MNARIDQYKHPDRRRHEAHSGPHGQHSAGMMIFLQGSASFAFGKNDSCVKDLVKLREIKPPAPESEALIPYPANIS